MFQRDQNTLEALDVNDGILAAEQQSLRSRNQVYSAKSKARGGPEAKACEVKPGCLVYLKEDGDKTKARDRYLVVSSDSDGCIIQKITKSLRNVKYKVKPSELYPVTPTVNDANISAFTADYEEDEEETNDDIPDVYCQSAPQSNVGPSCSLPVDLDDTLGTKIGASVTAEDAEVDRMVTNTEAQEVPEVPQEVPVTTEDEAVATSEDHPGSHGSPPDDEPPTRRRPKRQTRPPKRFADYVVYTE